MFPEIKEPVKDRPTYSHSCPTNETLARFLKGDSTHHEIDSLGEHLDTCQDCQNRAEALNASLSILPSEDIADSSSVSTSHQATILELGGLLQPTEDSSLLGRLGNFVVHDVLDRGGMGIVLRGEDPDLKRKVAIKVLSPSLAAHPEARERFLREAQSAASIDHENVMPIFAVIRNATLPYLVMPLNEGGSLQDYLNKHKSLPYEDIVRVAKAVANALAAAHEKGLIHRDVKPANILLENNGEKVRLTDFGVARAAEAPELTRTGVLAGTPAFMAPEQIDGEDVDPRADLFGLGVVLYTLVTGTNPFEATTTTATIKRVAMDRPKPLSNSGRNLPLAFRKLVEQLLEKLPQNRPQSAEEVVDRLEALTTSAPPASRRRLVSAFVALVSTIMLIWYTTTMDRQTPEERREASLADLQLASERYANENYREGMALLCRALRSDPNNSEASQRLVNELVYRPLQSSTLEPYILETASRLEEVMYSTEGDRLMAFGFDQKMHFWKTTTFEREIFPLSWPAGVIPVCYAETAGIWAFYYAGNRSYWFIDSDTFGFHADAATIPEAHACAVLSDDASLMLVAGTEGTVYLWDVENREMNHTWQLHGAAISEVAISKNNQLGVSVSEDGTGVLLDLQTGKTIGVPMIHEGPIRSLVLHDDKGLIATGSADNTARLWNLADAEPVTPPLRHAVNCPDRGILVIFDKAGDLLLNAGSNDHAMRIWQTTSGQPTDVGSLPHPDVVSSINLDASGKRLATGCLDGTVRLWNLDSFRKIAPTFTLPDSIDHVDFSNGDQLSATTIDGRIHVYDLAPRDLVVNEPFLRLSEAIAGKRFRSQDDLVTLKPASIKSLRDHGVKEPRSMRIANWLVEDETTRERSPLNPRTLAKP